MTIKVEIQHEKQNGREFGYGIYVNGYVTDKFGIGPWMYASECVPFKASPEQIKAAEKRVRQNARPGIRTGAGRKI